MKKSAFIFQSILLLLFSTSVFSQEKIMGRVVDVKDSAVAFANVVLENNSDSSFITGTITKEDGSFQLEAHSNALLHVSSVGYADVRAPAQELNRIVLHEDVQVLNEIVVSGSTAPKTIIRKDALVTNVRGTYLAKMGNANDVLDRIPGISDRRGTIEVLGKGTPEIYVNGRKLRDNEELSQIRSDQVKEVAVIMNPGVEYDADAKVKAVIKIQTYRAEGEGFGISSKTVLGVQKYRYGSEVLDLNYTMKKVEAFVLFSYDYDKSLVRNHLMQQGVPSHPYRQENFMEETDKTRELEAKIGFIYNFSENHTVGVSYEHTKRLLKAGGTTVTDVLADSLHDSMNGISDAKSRKHHNLLNGFYQGSWGKLDVDANMDVLWDNSCGDSHVAETSALLTDQTVTATSKSRPRFFAERINFSYPVWKGSLSFGHQFSFVSRKSSYYNPEGVVDDNLTKIEEANHALYVQISQNLGRLMLTAGLRGEYVDSRYYEDGIRNDNQSRKYFNLFPSAAVILPVGKTVMQLGYSRKIDRPLYQQLSNTVAYVNRYTYEAGNPYLQPMYSNNLTFNLKYNWFVLMLSYSHIHDKIISTYVQYKDHPNVSLLRKDNADAIDNLQAMAVLSPSFGWYHPMLTAGIVAQWFSIDYMGKAKKLNTPLGIVRLNNTFVLPHDGMINADLSWRSTGNSENMRIKGVWQINLGFTKNIDKNWNVKFSCDDIFNTARRTDVTIYSGDRTFHMDKEAYSRCVELTVLYRFNVGRHQYKGKSVSNEEIKRL
ncbi:MAG: TonB-dependent receptor [Prevotella sp.]|nr:TonB-dependent receptor [Prevotella sp.]